MPIHVMKHYTRECLQDNPTVLFIFGDNNERTGYGGQAGAARGEPNAIGIRTKKVAAHGPGCYLTDKEYVFNLAWIMQDFKPIFNALANGTTVVWPEDGIGTGLADLKVRAPETLAFINNLVESLKKVYGVTPCALTP